VETVTDVLNHALTSANGTRARKAPTPPRGRKPTSSHRERNASL
jgi:hypothetical protein